MITLPFLTGRRPGGDQANAAVPIRVSNHDHLVHYPDTDVANVAIILAVIEPGQNGVAEDPLRRLEADAVLTYIGLVLGFVPAKLRCHTATIVCRYNAVEFNRLSQTKMSTTGRSGLVHQKPVDRRASIRRYDSFRNLLTNNAVSVAIAHETIRRMIPANWRDTVTPRLRASDLSVTIRVPPL